MKQLVLPIDTRPEPRFDTFVPGRNALALGQLQALVDDSAAGHAPTPCYLWGPPGSGKTHLLHAAALRARQRGTGVAWFSPADLTPWQLLDSDPDGTHTGCTGDAGDIANTINTTHTTGAAGTACTVHTANATADPSACAPPPCTLIVLDGCDAFDADQQQAAFSLFVEAAGPRRCLIAAAGRLPPVDLTVREDLRTRLGWGHVLALEPLSEAETRVALRSAARARGLTLADDVTTYLLTHFARDLNHLMAQIDRLDRFALEQRRAISLPMLRKMLADESSTR